MDFQVGTTFYSWEEFRTALEDWSIQDQFQFDVVKKDTKRARYRCQHHKSGCNWQLYVSFNPNLELQIKTLNARHTCAGIDAASSAPPQQSWLRRVIPTHLFITKTTKVQDIIDCVRMHYSQTVPYRTAQRVKAFLIKDRRENQIQQFQKIPHYLQLLKDKNSEIQVNLQLGLEEEFQRVFICPKESRQSFLHMRKFIAVDGTFLKARFVQTLLFAVGIDANGKNLLLAWAIVESENTDSWTWFLVNLKAAIPEVIGSTIISDRDKGLLAAEQIVFQDTIYSLICCVDLKGMFMFS